MIDEQQKLYLLNNHVRPDVEKFKNYTLKLKHAFDIRFGYGVIFKRRHYYLLLDDFELITKVVNFVDAGHIFGQEEITGSRRDNLRIFNWSTNPITQNMQPYAEAGIKNGISILRVRDIDHIEIFAVMSEDSEDKQPWLMAHTDFCVDYTRGINNLLATTHAPQMFVENDLFCFSQDIDTSIIEVTPDTCQLMRDILDELTKYGAYLNIRGDVVRITPQEWKVMTLIAQGQTIKQIAIALGISIDSVKTYIKRIKVKTSIHYKSEILTLRNLNYHL